MCEITRKPCYDLSAPMLSTVLVEDWSEDDCIDFLTSCAQIFRASNQSYLEVCIEKFRENLIVGSVLIDLENKDWELLIPFLGFRKHVQIELSKRMEEKKSGSDALSVSRNIAAEGAKACSYHKMLNALRIFFSRKFC